MGIMASVLDALMNGQALWGFPKSRRQHLAVLITIDLELAGYTIVKVGE